MYNNILLSRDAPFLKKLDKENLKTYYVKILVLTQDEVPIRPIEGRVSTGSLSINGSSNIRRSGSISFLAEEEKNDLTDIDNLLSMNKKIKILIGIENLIDKDYPDIVWFNQGIFIITNPSLQHSNSGVNISLQFKDKMCLLNGECGGNLPTSITFHEYDQVIGLDNGGGGSGYKNVPTNPNTYTVYLVNGQYKMWSKENGWIGEADQLKNKIGEVVQIKNRIFDIIQTLVCWYGNESMSKIIINDVPLELKQIVRYVGSNLLYHNPSTGAYTINQSVVAKNPNSWISFDYDEDCGYVYTDFIYPGELISSIGESITSVLDKIIQQLGNYEYFYDINGNFVFQEKKNYLNTQYDPVQIIDKETGKNILNKDNYYVDFTSNSRSIYSFKEGDILISSYSNTPNYLNVKNDYHIWGQSNNSNKDVIHYHLVLKEKPTLNYWVVTIKDNKVIAAREPNDGETGRLSKDWREELYLRGLDKIGRQQRPDIYEQEILDLFDDIYDMEKQEFRNVTAYPNNLKYWIDYIDDAKDLFDISVDTVGTKIVSYQKDKIKRLYNKDIPNVIIINTDAKGSAATLRSKCIVEGDVYANVTNNIYNKLAENTLGYSAEEVARDLLYQYANYTSTISLTAIPIYYLDVNTRITVEDRSSGIYGDYIVNTINLPLGLTGTMSIQATKALERV